MSCAGRWGLLVVGLVAVPLLGCSGDGASPGADEGPAYQGQAPAAQTTGDSSSPALPSDVVATPALTILSPKPDDVVQVPVTVQYVVSGFESGSEELALRLTIGTPPFYTQDWPVDGTGTASLPDDKMITGHRDLQFVLVGPDGAPLVGSAPVTINDVTIVGRR